LKGGDRNVPPTVGKKKRLKEEEKRELCPFSSIRVLGGGKKKRGGEGCSCATRKVEKIHP